MFETDASQTAVYDGCVSSLLDGCMLLLSTKKACGGSMTVPHNTRQGYNATVFAYGQTGSGRGCKEASRFSRGAAAFLFCLQVLVKPTPWVRVNGHRRGVLRRALFRRPHTSWVLQKHTLRKVGRCRNVVRGGNSKQLPTHRGKQFGDRLQSSGPCCV